MSSRAVPPETVAAMYARYQEGWNLEEVAAQFHYTGAAIQNIFKRNGLPRRAKALQSPRKQQQTLSMFADYQAGLSLREVGLKYGYTGPCIRYRFAKAGLPCRPQGGRH